MSGFGYKGNAHNLLIILVRMSLEGQGFTVEIEKLIRIDDGPQLRYKVDVYGERNGEIIMYECGDCSEIKLKWLRKNVGTVIHMPYLDKWCSQGWTNWRKGLTETDFERLSQRLSDRTW